MNRIAELRKKKGISQSKLGEIVGAAQNTVIGKMDLDNQIMQHLLKWHLILKFLLITY